MSTTIQRVSGSMEAAPTGKARERVRKILLACGPLSVLTYIGWREFAALQWEGYSRISNSISELQLTGTPTKSLLDPWEGWVYSGLSLAFGVGIWLSAQGSRSLRVVGALMILPAAANPLWLLFGEASLAAHIALAVMGILSWLGAMGFGAAALGKRFRIYSLVTLAVVVTFNALALSYAPEVKSGEPTPFIGLYERIAFGAYYLWLCLLAVALWRGGRREAGKEASPRAPEGAPSGLSTMAEMATDYAEGIRRWFAGPIDVCHDAKGEPAPVLLSRSADSCRRRCGRMSYGYRPSSFAVAE
jgi:hypothetical protein